MKRLLEREIATIRNPELPRKDFRESLENIGYLLGAQIMDDLPCKTISAKTELGKTAEHTIASENPVLISLLRAATPLYNGLLKAFPESETGWIGTSRNEETLKSTISYTALPKITGRTILIIDTMLATGGSIIDAYKHILQYEPKEVLVVCTIASQDAINKINEEGLKIYAAKIDPLLNENGFIVPGLGDAGDRCYGKKL